MALQLCMTQKGVQCKKRSSIASVDCGRAKVSKLTMVFILLGFISCAGVMYIFQINKLATMGYEIKEKERQIEDLRKKNETLQIRAAELRSMQNLEADKEQMKMKKPVNTTYIEVGGSVAMK